MQSQSYDCKTAHAEKDFFYIIERKHCVCVLFFLNNFMYFLVKTIINERFSSIRANDVFNKFRAALRFTKY